MDEPMNCQICKREMQLVTKNKSLCSLMQSRQKEKEIRKIRGSYQKRLGDKEEKIADLNTQIEKLTQKLQCYEDPPKSMLFSPFDSSFLLPSPTHSRIDETCFFCENWTQKKRDETYRQCTFELVNIYQKERHNHIPKRKRKKKRVTKKRKKRVGKAGGIVRHGFFFFREKRALKIIGTRIPPSELLRTNRGEGSGPAINQTKILERNKEVW